MLIVKYIVNYVLLEFILQAPGHPVHIYLCFVYCLDFNKSRNVSLVFLIQANTIIGATKHTAGQMILGHPKYEIVFGAITNGKFFQHCDNNIDIFSISNCSYCSQSSFLHFLIALFIFIALPTIAIGIVVSFFAFSLSQVITL